MLDWRIAFSLALLVHVVRSNDATIVQDENGHLYINTPNFELNVTKVFINGIDVASRIHEHDDRLKHIDVMQNSPTACPSFNFNFQHEESLGNFKISGGTMSYNTSNSSDAFMQLEDTDGTKMTLTMSKLSWFGSPLNWSNCSSIDFDLIVLQYEGNFTPLKLQLHGHDGQIIEFTETDVSRLARRQWSHFHIPLNSEFWPLHDNEEFDAVISQIVKLELIVDVTNSMETIGLNNFKLM